MRIEKFEDIITWQKGKSLAVDIYKHFKSNKDYGFRDQIQRAAISISNNIAEGFDRKGNKEFAHFLYISKGSCAEVRSMLYIALELKYLKEGEANNLISKSDEISKM
jgi:four helix bundle protein